MNNDRAYEWISQNLTAIHGYAYARLYDKDQVEELVSDIVYEILTSTYSLHDEQAFWGYVWKIAENTFRKFIRRHQRRADTECLSEDMSDIDLSVPSPAQEYVEQEERDEKLYLLRRELSLLTHTHREVCVAYYLRNLSCAEIAKKQNISVDMVKYHLFKTRKLLKEGIGMTRKLGEKSYNPGTFRLDFWGDWNHYDNLFDRKLPGSIVLAAYHVPMRAEELSLELGVAMPYLEDEIEALTKAGVLRKIGEKYQTNLVILTDDYEKDFARRTQPLYTEVADEIFDLAQKVLPSIRALHFQGNDYDDNRLLIGLLNIAMVEAYAKSREISPMGAPPDLPLGGHGWVFGVDNDYANHHYLGVTMHNENRAGTAWFSAENYRVLKSCQIWTHNGFREKSEAMWDAVLEKTRNVENIHIPWLIEHKFITDTDGKLRANFPVFEEPVFCEVCEILDPIACRVADFMVDISNRAEHILSDLVPESVKDQCADIAKIHHRLAVSAVLMEDLIARAKLTVPEGEVPVCVYGVRR